MYFVIISVVVIINCISCNASDIFHQKSRTTFLPDIESTYFGYSVVLSNSSLIVGAPKAVSKLKDSIAPGQVFTCGLKNLDHGPVTCHPLGMGVTEHDMSIRRTINVKDFFRNDMWYGATIATVPEGKLFVCAPRWADPYREKHLLAHGACYVETKKRGITLTPLKDAHRLAYLTDGSRREYGEYGTHLNFYAYGQAGMSIKVTEDNSVIIGAPGLMQWTGGIIDYKFNPDPNSVFFNKQPTANPYFTRDLGPDDYFGYSVESGRFEINGSTLYVAGAPRSKRGFGLVLVFEPPIRENDPLKIRAKVIGPHLGSYFGANLCCTDLNGDGRTDLLVGAPNYVMKEDEMPYDQGGVFVYLADETSGEEPMFILREAGHVTGIGESGARFGSAIAILGDIDGDGFNDVAIGAPWENEGHGTVYIYKGNSQGLNSQYLQRIQADDAKGFGISISKGLDIDVNNCKDLAVGAHATATVYLYRCIPTISVEAYIKVPHAMSLHYHAPYFATEFCIKVKSNELWSQVKIDVQVSVQIDHELNRASAEEDQYTVTLQPGTIKCDSQNIQVQPTANLTKPIPMLMKLTPDDSFIYNSSVFPKHAARLSEDSTLDAKLEIQLMWDCGDDLVCTPLLVFSLEAIDSVYVPGETKRLGVKVQVLNVKEPAYDVQVILRLPLHPKRVPGFCSLHGLNMTCNVHSPLKRGESDEWEIELEYFLRGVGKEVLKVEAELKHPVYIKSDNKRAFKDVNITVVPKAEFKIFGKALPNDTMIITREKFYDAGNVSFVHYYEIKNLGPSDWIKLKAVINLPKNVTLSNDINDCKILNETASCTWSVPVAKSVLVELSFKYNLSMFGQYLDELTTFNATTTITLVTVKKERLSVTTKLLLDPPNPMWPYIVAIAVSTIIGFLLLTGIVYGLHKYGFFSRASREELRRRKLEEEESSPDEEPGCSTSPPSEADESTVELLSEDSD